MSLGTWSLELTRPGALLVLLLVPLLLVGFRRSLVDASIGQRRLSLLVRGVVVGLLALALAGLIARVPSDEAFVVLCVDQSRSVGEAGRARAAAFVAEVVAARGADGVAVLPFARTPALIRRVSAADDVAAALASSAELDVDATNLERAIESASAAMPPFVRRRIVLLTDGNETEGAALDAVLALDDTRVFAVPLAVTAGPEVQLSSVSARDRVRRGESFEIEIVIDSDHDDEVLVEVFRGARRVVSETRRISAGENRFRFAQLAADERLIRFTARVSGARDTSLDNNADSALVFADGAPRILVVDSEPETVRYLDWALTQEGIEVDVRPAAGLPRTLAELEGYELLILSDVPATSLGVQQMETIRTWVRDLGGGLMMLGGERSFGLGGYYKTVIEDVLPVRSDFEKEREKPSLAMVLVIDKSGSMSGLKIELAKDAARSAVELLGPRDKIGVIAFDGKPQWVSELRSTADKVFILDRIGSLAAGGGTSLHPAMEEAYQALDATAAKLKHVIILSDGHSQPGDFIGVASTMAGARMTASTVAVGNEADRGVLEEIARIGGGRYYFTDDPASIPQIFAKETIAASRSAIREEPFLPLVVRQAPVLEGLDFAGAPFLLGFVVTRAKPTSEVILATESGEPLLAWWRYGLGRAAAFTSDAKSRWGAEWVSWSGFSRFWAQVVREVMRRAEVGGLDVVVERIGADVHVTVDAADATGEWVSGAPTRVAWIAPSLDRREVGLAPTAPGRYEGRFPIEGPGAYHIEVEQARADGVPVRRSCGLVVGYADELRLRPVNRDGLARLARSGGGTVDPAPRDLFAPDEAAASRVWPLRRWLLALALVLFVLDVALRRIERARQRREIEV